MGLYTNSQLIHNTAISVRKQPVSGIRPGGLNFHRNVLRRAAHRSSLAASSPNDLRQFLGSIASALPGGGPKQHAGLIAAFSYTIPASIKVCQGDLGRYVSFFDSGPKEASRGHVRSRFRPVTQVQIMLCLGKIGVAGIGGFWR